MISSMTTSGLAQTNNKPESFQLKHHDGSVDFIARVSGSSSASMSARYIGESRDIALSLQTYALEKQMEIESLVKALDWQHKTIEYNSSYVALLLGQIDDDEFEAAAELMAITREHRAPQEVIPTINNLLNLTNIPFTESDFAGILNCHESVIRQAVEFISRLKEESTKVME